MPVSNPSQTMAESSSRKRTHAEITRSESRSLSPHPPSKRRRTTFSPLHTAFPPPPLPTEPTTMPSEQSRFEGDGFDFRRPAMSVMNHSAPQMQETIDLTEDDDTSRPTATYESHSAVPHHSESGSLPNLGRAPPFGRVAPALEVIDLSEDDGSNTQPPRHAPSSPEIEFIGASTRQIPNPVPRLPTPPTMRRRAYDGMAHIMRGASGLILGNLRNRPDDLIEIIDQLDGLPGPGFAPGLTGNEDTGAYEHLHMDYAQPALGMGMGMGMDLHIDENNAPTRPGVYKEPLKAREGYTRTYDEEDMLVCGFCGDELAAGEDEVKQQVWVIKQCGHAYCGTCATTRPLTKGANNRERKKGGKNMFRTCTVPDCGKDVSSKTKMFQVYL